MAKQKRPYQPPRIVASDAFERLALACNGNRSRQAIKGAPRCTTTTAS